MTTIKQCVIVSALAIASAVQAVPYYWNGGDGTWDTATANWRYNASDGVATNWPADDATAEAVFAGTGSKVTVSGTVNAGKLTFNTGGWSVTNGTLVLKGVSTLSVNAQTSTVFSAIQGTVGLTITGGGMLSLRGANKTYTGGTSITNASVWITPATAGTFNNILGSGSTGNITFDNARLIMLLNTSTYTINWGMTIGSGGATFVADGGGANAYMKIAASKLSGSGTLTLTRTGTIERLYPDGGQPNFAGKWIIDTIYFDHFPTNWGTATGDDVITLRNGGYLVADNQGNTTPSTVGNTNQGIRVENNGTGGFNVSGNNIASWIINAKITGPGDPVNIYACKSSSLATILANPQNSYSGVTDLYPGTTPYEGYVRLGASEVIPNGTGKGHVRFRGSSSRFSLLDLNGQTETVNALETGVETGGTGGMILNTSNAPATLIVGDANTSGKTFRGNIMQTSGTISFTKIGSGVQTLSGTNQWSGSTTVTNGELVLDKAAEVNGVLGSLVMAGGTLTVKGKSSGTSSQQFGAATFQNGHHALSASGTLKITANGGSGTTVTTTGTWSRLPYTTVSIDTTSATAVFKATNLTLTNSLIGGYATLKNTADGWCFAATDGSGNMIASPGSTLLDATLAASDLSGTANYLITNSTSFSGPAATQTLFSVRVTGMNPSARTINPNSKVIDVKSGGVLLDSPTDAVLFEGSGAWTSASGELFAHFSNLRGLWYTDIIDYSASTKLSLVKDGTALLDLYAQPYTGGTYINQGELRLRGNYPGKPFPSFTSSFYVNQGGTLSIYWTNAVIGGLTQKTAVGGAVIAYVVPGVGSTNTLCVGNGNADGDFNGSMYDAGGTLSLCKIGTGTQTLSGVKNTYAGGTVLREGVLSVSSTNNIGGANARIIFAGGTLRITGTAFNTFGATPVSGSGTLEIVEAGNLFTLAGNVPGTLTKRGAGSLTVSGVLDGVITEQPGLVATSGAGVVSNWTVKALAPNTMYVASGTQAVSGNLTLSGNYTFNLNTNGSCDTFASTGNVVLDSVVVTVADPSKLTDRSKSYTLVTAGAGKTVSVTGSAPVATNLPTNWKLQVVGQSLTVRYVPAGTMIRIF